MSKSVSFSVTLSLSLRWELSYLGLDEQTTVVVRDGTIWGQERYRPLRVYLVGFCGGHLRERAGETLDRGKLGIRPSAVEV